VTIRVRSLLFGLLLQPFIEEATGFEFGIARGFAVEFVSIFCKEDFSQIGIGEVRKSFTEVVEPCKEVLVGFRFRCFSLFHSASNPWTRLLDLSDGVRF
jgi:hypothetical protein